MRVEDRFIVPAPPSVVWQAITDPAIVAPCVPGCEDVEVLSPTRYRATVTVQIGPIKARFNLTVEIEELVLGVEIRSVTRGEEGTKASILTAANLLRLSPTPDGRTEIHYVSDVTIAGRLGKYGFGIMQKKAKALGEAFAEAFRGKIAARSGAAATGPARD